MKMHNVSPLRVRNIRQLIVGLFALLMTSVVYSDEQLYFYHTDHLGTPQVMTDEQGQVVWQAHYQPFGGVDIATNTINNDERFPGQLLDSETGLHYNYFRDYDPTMGRYITSDPIGLKGGLNTYAYAEGSPIKLVDPLGLDPWVGGSAGGRIDFMIGGGAARTGTLSNTKTGETCAVSYRCLNVGVGALVTGGADVSFSLMGPSCGKKLEGFGFSITLDIVPPGAPGIGGSIDVSNAGLGAGIGPQAGAGLFLGGSLCHVTVIKCWNSPCECEK